MFELNFENINWLAVVLAAVASFMIGGLWYAVLFGKAWVRLHHYSQEDVQRMSKTQLQAFGIFLVGDLFAAMVLGLLIANLPVATGFAGATLGALVWFGFTATNLGMHAAAHRKAPSAWAIDAGHSLVTLSVMGLILGAWG